MQSLAQDLAPVSRVGPGSRDLVGRVLSDTYRVVQILDQGGMGVVLDAEHMRLHRRVAIKLIAEHLVGDQDALARFHSEAEIISQLQHPHIVQVFDYDTTQHGQPFLVMELLHGESLASRLERERLIPMAESVRIAGQVASALSAAHAAAIVHRDLKPANIFLVNIPGEPAFVKLLDFGISKRAGAGRRITRASDVLGTPEYMAPEQALGHTATADQRADQYALAVIVFEMLSGRPPLRGEDMMSTLYQVAHEMPPPLSAVAPPWLPKAVSDVVARALLKDPAERYPDVHAFAEALAVAAGCRPSSAAETRSVVSVGRYGVQVHANTERVEAPPPDVVPLPVPSSNGPRRPKVVGSNTVQAVAYEVDAGVQAYGEGRLDAAAVHVQRAIDLASTSKSTDAHEAIEAMSGRLEQILTDNLGGPRQRLAAHFVPSAHPERNPEEAFLLSRLDGAATLEEVLDVSPLGHLETLRTLSALVERGAIGRL